MSVPHRPYLGRSAPDRVEERSRRLLDAGLECYGTTGYAATGVRQLCTEAGLTTRYFYESFKDREALFLAVFDQVTEELFTTAAEAVVAAGPDARDQLGAAVTAFLRAMAEDPRKPRLIFREPAAVGPAAEEHMRITLRRFADLAQLTARPHLPASVPDGTVRLVALSIVGTLERVVIEWQDGQLPRDLDAVAAECVTVFVAMLEGLTP